MYIYTHTSYVHRCTRTWLFGNVYCLLLAGFPHPCWPWIVVSHFEIPVPLMYVQVHFPTVHPCDVFGLGRGLCRNRCLFLLAGDQSVSFLSFLDPGLAKDIFELGNSPLPISEAMATSSFWLAFPGDIHVGPYLSFQLFLWLFWEGNSSLYFHGPCSPSNRIKFSLRQSVD